MSDRARFHLLTVELNNLILKLIFLFAALYTECEIYAN